MADIDDIELRSIGLADRDVYLSWLQDPALVSWHFSIDDIEGEFRRVCRSMHNYIIECDGRPVGQVAVDAHWEEGNDAELGVMVIPSRQGRGIAREATTRVIDIVFREENIAEIWAGVLLVNQRALSFCRALGFTEHGSDDDVGEPNVLYHLTREDWREMISKN